LITNLFNINNWVSVSEASGIVSNEEATKSVKDLDIIMSNGMITITATSKTATSTIKYRTTGFTISTKEQTSTVTAKDYTGPAAPHTPSGKFYFSNAQKIPGADEGGLTTTTYVFTEDKVKQALKNILDLDNLSNTTMIYFNAIFQTYEAVNGKEIILTQEITNWKTIMNDQWWGEGTLEGFEKYFNIGLKFSPGYQKNSLYFDYNNGKTLQGDLDSKYINDTVKWNNNVTDAITVSGKTYDLKGYYVEAKESGVTVSETKSRYIDRDGVTVSQIINSSAKVPYGGLNVHMVYEIDESTIPYQNTLYYKYNSRIPKKVSDLGVKLPGKTITWATQVKNNTPESVLGEGTYQLQGYYIEAKDKDIRLQGKTSLYKSIDKVNDDAIINGKAIVVKGGINIYIVYGNEPITPTPTPKPSVTPAPEVPPVEIPEGGSETQPINQPLSTGIIQADIREQQRFVVQQGIATTESLYTQVDTTEYLIGYNFEKEVVVKEYPVKASKTYNLTWTDAKDNTKTVTESKTITQTVTIKRACAYWAINSLNYYIIDNATIYNKALPDGKSVMYPNGSYYKPPSLSIMRNLNQSYHIIDPAGVTGVILDDKNLSSSDGSKPVIDAEDFTYEANQKIGEIKVRSDYLSFDGMVVMDNQIYEKEAPNLSNLTALNHPTEKTGENVLYKPNQIIEATLKNDTYSSSGNMVYKKHPNSISGASNTRSNAILNINDVVVHTPVICDVSISADNKKFVQLLDPEDDYVPLVLDPNSSLSDFTVKISNTGKHSNRTGYYTRNMAWSLRSPNIVSYLAKKNDFYRNEVKFPFDVYYKKMSGEDEFIPKDTWFRIAFTSPTFYLPMWVNEGKYTVQFRTIAVNAVTEDQQNLKTEPYANTMSYNYVATDTVKVQVSGRIYGLTITDISDKRDWEEVFHANGTSGLKIYEGYNSGVNKTKYSNSYTYDYTVGTNDQYGNDTGRLSRFTFPLVNGSHPKWSNIGIMKKGYSVSFKLNTTGNMFGSGNNVLIRPKFYYVDAQGKNRQEIDIYYSQYFNKKSHDLVKVESALDKTNINRYKCGDLYLGIPNSQLDLMANIFNVSLNEYKSRAADLFTYSKIKINLPLMTYTNNAYLKKVVNSGQYSKIKSANISQVDIVKRMQTWYAEYWLPADIHAVAQGFDVIDYAAKKGITYKENFWLTNGYIIVNFDIVTVDSEGNEIMSYTNKPNSLKGYCSMWNLENTVDHKVSYNGKSKKSVNFNFMPGDFLIFYTDISLREDYTTYIIN
jgi:hypothetical protein